MNIFRLNIEKKFSKLQADSLAIESEKIIEELRTHLGESKFFEYFKF